jgi:hypothetical protein
MTIHYEFAKLEVMNSTIGEWIPIEFKSFQFEPLKSQGYVFNKDAYFRDAKFVTSEEGTIVTVTATREDWIRFIADHPEFLPYLISVEPVLNISDNEQ